MTKPICLLAYDGMELLDFAGPQSALHEAAQVCSDSYELKVIGFSKAPVQCEAGLQIVPAIGIDEVKQCHTLIIPGGRGARRIALPSVQMMRLKSLMSRCERLVTICTGVYLAAEIGLPDNTRVATHWAFAPDLKKQYSSLAVDSESIFVQDGKYWSSAGITSGIDLTLRLIEIDCGPTVAHHVAKHLVVYSKRSGSQKQYSNVLDIQTPKSNRIAIITNWVKEHVSETITVKQLSEVACLSERQCHRLFLKETAMTPARFVEKYRMQLASDLLATTEKEVKSIALALGFKTYNGFARAFERSFAVSPLKYRQSFFA
ncbi:GlxA family transcriptional regulator [Alteromonas lipotrueiana]|uniref:GlxA family transcriptional regulator n=1 Tax=Alteromonas lipotrueiana TaxID=2803815 RepID=UPI001C4422DD|nr:DJ-1/PfpI family protein [Alteromonas lipotrueiana]